MNILQSRWRPPARLAAFTIQFCRICTEFWAARNTRERGLTIAIAFVAMAFIATDRLKTMRSAYDELSLMHDARAARKMLLDAAPDVSKILAMRADELTVARSLDAETAMARVEKLLTSVKMAAETGRPVTKDIGAAKSHVLTLRISETGITEIVAFRRALDSAGLPMAMTGLEIEADSQAPEKLRARIEITALQPK